MKKHWSAEQKAVQHLIGDSFKPQWQRGPQLQASRATRTNPRLTVHQFKKKNLKQALINKQYKKKRLHERL